MTTTNNLRNITEDPKNEWSKLCKTEHIVVAMLIHLCLDGTISLTTDTPDSAIEAVLEQKYNNNWFSITYISLKDLLAMYLLSGKIFQTFGIFTDIKIIITHTYQ